MQYHIQTFGETLRPLRKAKSPAGPYRDISTDKAKRAFWPGISPAIRALLSTDGSFTLLLVALIDEPIIAEPIDLPAPKTDARISLLKADSFDRLLFRSAVLKSAESGRVAAYVESFTVLDRMSKEIQELLAAGTHT